MGQWDCPSHPMGQWDIQGCPHLRHFWTALEVERKESGEEGQESGEDREETVGWKKEGR